MGDFGLTTISVKNLASLAMPGTCERCFWIKVRTCFKTPWSIFPGVFGDLDSYSKKVTEAWMKKHPGTLPPWLTALSLGDGIEQLPCPHWSKFSFTHSSGITVRGTPDERLLLKDGTVVILDYKTAKFSPGKMDTLLPLYETQLTGYAWLTKKMENRETSSARLMYYSPPDNTYAITDRDIEEIGFRMTFTGNSVPVGIDMDAFESLILRAQDIAAMPEPPNSCGCKDCDLLRQIQDML